jgi:hypothetical protein
LGFFPRFSFDFPALPFAALGGEDAAAAAEVICFCLPRKLLISKCSFEHHVELCSCGLENFGGTLL